MSATRDQSQKAAFVYSNLYEFYKKSKASGLSGSGKVLRASDLRQSGRSFAESELQIKAFAPPELAGQRASVQPSGPTPKGASRGAAERPASNWAGGKPWAVPVTSLPKPTGPVDDLKENLRSLGELHTRMRFMLKELAVLLDEEDDG
ncbi:MAG: hypothetical protein AAB425_10075 [Bdellovibrionota bacterium]